MTAVTTPPYMSEASVKRLTALQTVKMGKGYLVCGKKVMVMPALGLVFTSVSFCKRRKAKATPFPRMFWTGAIKQSPRYRACRATQI